MARIWIDVTGIRQANLLAALARSMKTKSELLVTTSESRSEEIMQFASVQPLRVSSHDPDPLQSYADRVLRLSTRIEEFKPDILIGDLDPAAVRTAFGLGIPSWTIYANGHGKSTTDAQRMMSYPLCERIFASSFFDERKLILEGAPKDRLFSFRGFNECYLMSEKHASGPIRRILLRPNGHDSPNWLHDLGGSLLDGIDKARLTILGAKDRAASTLQDLGGRVKLLDFTPYPPVLKQDLFVGWGRMLGESFVLGVPSVRIGQETHPDLSLAYSHQPAISEPSNIVSVLHGMLDEDAGPSPVDGLKSPVDLVISELRSQGIIK